MEFGQGRGKGRFVQHEIHRVAGRPAATVGVLVESNMQHRCRQACKVRQAKESLTTEQHAQQ